MRVTQNMITNDLLRDISSNRNELAKIQNQVSSGLKVRLPSDEPAAFATSKGLEEQLARNEEYQQAIQSGLSQSRVAQDSIDTMVDQMVDLKRITVHGANDKALEASDREALADEVASIREVMVDRLNANTDGRYLFAGTQVNDAPFELDGTDVTYNGNNDDLTVPVNDGMEVKVSLHGEEVTDFNGDNVFDMLDRIETALRNNDDAAVKAELDTVDDAVAHISSAGSNLGSRINQLEFTNEQFEVGNINLKSEVSRLVDTDYAESLSELQKYQTAYQAALSANADLLQTSLLNFLR